MVEEADHEVIKASAEQLYGSGQPIWHPDDAWNQRVRMEIDRFGRRHAEPLLRRAKTVLDVGCGSEPYEWLPPDRVSVDRFEGQVRGARHGIVADIEALPFGDREFEFVVSVGAVINYASAAEGIRELARVTKVGGSLLLQFETSTSFEHALTGRRGSSALRIETANAGRPETLWVYNPDYVYRLLARGGFQIRRRRRFHILSAFGLRIGLSHQRAARLSALDWGFGWLGGFADNIILLAEKSGTGAFGDEARTSR